MEVANPIYDVVFKYLMEDDRVAKTIIGALTGFDVVDLEFRPTEYSSESDKVHNFTVYRLDFAARVRTDKGVHLVLIEIQKAKFPTDIMRFRRYLGEQYANPANVGYVEGPNKRKRKVADPIFGIYLLGHKLNTTNSPVIRVKRSCIDVATGDQLSGPEEFIESLTHDSVIVQIPELHEKRRNKLEILLSIFDQDLKVSSDGHILNINEADYPEEFKFIVRRLLQANSEPELRKKMTIEDEIISELEERERCIAELGEQAEEALLVAAKAKAETQEAKAETQEAKAETQEAKAETQEAKAETERALDNAASILAQQMNISLEQARKMLEQ